MCTCSAVSSFNLKTTFYRSRNRSTEVRCHKAGRIRIQTQVTKSDSRVYMFLSISLYDRFVITRNKSKQKASWNVAGILCISAMPLSSSKICFSQKKQPTALLQLTFSITFRSDVLSYPSQPHTQNAKAGVNKSSRSYSHCHKQQKPWETENILLNYSGLKEKITTATTIRIQRNVWDDQLVHHQKTVIPYVLKLNTHLTNQGPCMWIYSIECMWCPRKYMYNVHSRFAHDGQKLETIQMPTNRRTDKS